jgi:hypothetical protein
MCYVDWLLLVTWVVGVAVIGVTVGLQSVHAHRAGTDAEILGSRVTLVSLLVLPVFGGVIALLPVCDQGAKPSLGRTLNATISSFVYLLGIFLLILLEPYYYPGEVAAMFGYWGIIGAAAQGYLSWAVTKLVH